MQDRRQQLSDVEQANQQAASESADLQSERAKRQKENDALRRQVKSLTISIRKLEKDVSTKQTKTTAQQAEQQRILAEVRKLKESSRSSDFIEDPEEKRLELKRLQQRRDQLEKEAAGLMRL